MSGRYTPLSSWHSLTRGSFSSLLIGLLLLFGVETVQGQSFTTSTLQNLAVSSPTSLQFGPDGRLYVSQQDGTILAVSVTQNGANDYSATSVETINLIKAIPNHNDDGSLAPALWQGTRQVTGIYVTADPNSPTLPVVYVGSSDPRIGAGSDGDDTSLDTNSGIITKLTYNGSSWTAVDLIRGLPRSEENHSTNGLEIDPATNTMYIAQGGHTNAGAPSNNFALTNEYALSAAILSVDLDAIEALPTKIDDDGRAYKYILPTLNDPMRADNTSGSWSTVSAFDEARHENASIQVGGKFYVLGGRETTTVRIYDPATDSWSTGATMPTTAGWPSTNLHHFQAIEVNGLIYAVGALTGSYPDEPPATNVYIYDPTADAWTLGPEIPVDRRRGSAGAAVYNGKIYIVGGNANGHSGPGSVQFDEFDPATGTFTTLADIPRARDHFYATVAGDKLYAIAGRESDLSDSNVFNQMVAEVDVYDFSTQTWTTLASSSNIPTPRAAPATGLINGEIIVAGGESEQSLAHSETEAFDVQTQTWRSLDPMETPRHATQGLTYNGQMYVVAGSPKKGSAGGAILDLEVLDLQVVNGYTDPNDPFGGNDGLNQAKIDPNGPVQIYSPGWRNAYDLELSEAGQLWAIDNGANPGWGGHPLGESDYPSDPDGTPYGVCTNDYDPDEPGSTDIGPGGDPKVNNVDGLHVVTQGYYAGHPAPVRGNLDAGLYLNGTWLQPDAPGLPSDWNELVPSANPVECDYRSPGVVNGALATWYKKSVNGIVEYTTQSNLQGDLLLASLNDGEIKLVDVDADGTGVLGTSTLASGISSPLDVTQTDESTPYPGNVWVAAYGGGGEIIVLEPDPDLVCEGTYDATIDEDGDGYTNADEIDNDANPCSAADAPANNDLADEQAEIEAGTRTFLLSDLNDPDDDNDTVLDLSDPFQTDGTNGTNKELPAFEDLFLGSIEQTLAGGVGFTGLMTNGTDDYKSLFDIDNLLTGGATGQFSIIEVPPGTARGTTNTQKNGFQLGIQPPPAPYYIEVQMIGPYFNGTPTNGFVQGFYAGTGSQSDYVEVSLSASSDFSALGAEGGIEVVTETNDTPSRTLYPVSDLVGSSQSLNLLLKVDPIAGTVQPAYALGEGAVTDLGTPVSVSGALLDAFQGNHSIGSGITSGLAVGVITTTGSATSTFQADYEFIRVEEIPQTSAGTLAVTQGATLDATTTSAGAFGLTNTSTGGERIQTARIDLRSSHLSDLVFDPNGTAGATDAKTLTVDGGGTATGYTNHTYLAPTNGVDGNDGYGVLELTFTDFDPNETFSFSIDVDPNSIKGSAAPGPNGSAHVSGLELTGTALALTFEDGVTQTSALFRGDGSTTVSGGFASAQSSTPAAPSVSISSVSTLPATVSDPNQTLQVTGAPGETVRLLHLEAGLFVPSTGGYQTAPYDANSAVQVQEYTATLDASGVADINVTLQNSVANGGINLFSAVAVNSSGGLSKPSAPAVVQYEPLILTALTRLNTGGSAYTDIDDNVWDGDAFASGGTKYKSSEAISDTEDDPLYQTERYGDFTYNIPVSTGTYAVRLHFAEVFFGVVRGTSDPGQRVFNVYAEGTKVLDQFDILAETGAPLTPLVKQLNGISVSDGDLTLRFESVVNNAKINAIEVLSEEAATTYTVATSTQGSGTVTKSPNQSSYTAGTVVDLTATPDSGWEFVEWTGDVTGTTNPVSVTVNSNLSATANFQETVTQYTITTSTKGNGSIVKTPDQASYDAGSTVELTAVPDQGWYFAGWSGELTGTQNPITVTLNADYVISATFEELPTADAFVADLLIRDATGKSLTRRFGADNSATDGFDSGVDVEAPPAPPAGAFDARFENSLTGPLTTDVRASVTHPSSITWTLAVQGDQTPLTMTWDPSLFPPGTLTMTSSADGTTVDMKTQGEYVMASEPTDLTITFSPYDPAALASVSKSVNEGWALWGLSYDVGALPFTSVLPLAQEGSLIGYDGAYEVHDRMHLGAGYWVNFGSSGTETIDGYPVSKVTLALDAGWNLITGPACEVALPTSITAAYVYENGSYVATTSSMPFKALWAYVDAPTVSTLDCSTSSQTLAAKTAEAKRATDEVPARMTLTLTDANGAQQTLYMTSPTDSDRASQYLLPPRPPRSLFDARFTSDRRVSWDRTPSIVLQSESYPITVSVAGKAASGSIVEQSTKGEERTHLLRDGTTFEVEDRDVSTLKMNLPESVLKDLPKAFALKGNYPNPFLSTTTIVVDLPEEALIDLEVFNILGQRVMRIEDQKTPSGTGQTLQLQTSLASGVYFYRVHAKMDSDTVTKTGKMVIVQ